MTVVSKPVPTFKPHWLRKDNPARGRRPKTPRTDFERKWFDFHTELHDPAPLGYRRQPKGRRAKSGQWWRRPDPWLSKPLNYRERQSVKKAANGEQGAW